MLKLPGTIKWVITDFDGILTDNFVYIGDNMSMMRRINFMDIIGLHNLYKKGINVGIISGETNPVMDMLAKKFELKEVHGKVHNKIEVLKSIIAKYNLSQDEYLYIGDDINDIECLNYAKYKITVPHSVEALKGLDGIQVTERASGFGAFREVADCLIN